MSIASWTLRCLGLTTRKALDADLRAKDAELSELRSRYAAHAETVRKGHAQAERDWRVREGALEGERESLKARLESKATLLAEGHELMADWMRRGGAFETPPVLSHKG